MLSSSFQHVLSRHNQKRKKQWSDLNFLSDDNVMTSNPLEIELLLLEEGFFIQFGKIVFEWLLCNNQNTKEREKDVDKSMIKAYKSIEEKLKRICPTYVNKNRTSREREREMVSETLMNQVYVSSWWSTQDTIVSI